MQDLWLIVILAAVFTFGWYLMGKVDAFLESDSEDDDEIDICDKK